MNWEILRSYVLRLEGNMRDVDWLEDRASLKNVRQESGIAGALVWLNSDMTQGDVQEEMLNEGFLIRRDNISRGVKHIRSAVGNSTVDERFDTNYA